jgi:transcriptional regulator with XRE-family HTH domain
MDKIERYKFILARRVQDAMDKHYFGLRSQTQKIERLAKESGVGRPTVQRILDPETHGTYSPGLTKVDKIAKALKVPLPYLLTDPDYSDRI